MIDISEQQKLFESIGQILEKEIECFAIGGTAMMLKGIKEQTLDVDIVFNNFEDREVFIRALKKLNATESSARIVYGNKENTPKMMNFINVRFDLFLNKIITSYFSNKMKERANEIHQFGDKLKIKPADQNDVLIMKSVTSRDKDIEDIILIYKTSKINWDFILEAAEEQVKMGNELAILNLGEKLEKLTNKKLIKIPKDFSDKLWKLFNKQVKSKSKKNKEGSTS